MDGSSAENLACTHLKEHGLKILNRNYASRRGEIDIIARDHAILIFVEVRFRSQSRFGSAADSINHRKQQRVIHAAQTYLQKHNLYEKVSCRFDTICIFPDTRSDGSNRGNVQHYAVEWLRNAFGA